LEAVQLSTNKNGEKEKMKHNIIILLVTTLILLNSVVAIQDQSFYKVNLNYNHRDLKLESMIVLIGEVSDNKINTEGDYKLELVGLDGKKVYSTTFDFGLSIHTESINPETGEITSEEIILNETGVVLRIPYHPNGKVINIYNSDEIKILEIDVSLFAQGCGNNLCDPGETYQTCQQDCSLEPEEEQRFTGSSTIPSLQEHIEAKDGEKKPTTTKVILFIGPLLIFIVILIIWFYRRKNQARL
jgi:hypothetical protein